MGLVLGIDVGWCGTGLVLARPHKDGSFELLDAATIHSTDAVSAAKSAHIKAQKAAGVPKGKVKAFKPRVMDVTQLRARFLFTELFRYIREHPGIKGIVAELPTGGAKDSNAAVAMATAVGVYASVTALMHIPTEEYTPASSKTALFGPPNDAITKEKRPDITKEMVMSKIIAMYPEFPWRRHLNGQYVGRLVDTDVEHQADAVMLLHAAKGGKLVTSLAE